MDTLQAANNYLGINYPLKYGGREADTMTCAYLIKEMSKLCSGVAGSVTTAGMTSAYLIPAVGSEAQKGLSVSKTFDKLGWSSQDTAEVSLSDVIVPEENIVGGLGKGLAGVFASINFTRILIAATAWGVAEAALENAIAFVNRKMHHGKMLSRHQGVRSELANMAVEIESTGLLVYQAALMQDKGIRNRKQAAMAKYYATNTAKRVSRETNRIQGRDGFSNAHQSAIFFCDTPIFTIADGICGLPADSEGLEFGFTYSRDALGRFFLNGSSKFIINGTIADYFIIPARKAGADGQTGEPVTLFILPNTGSTVHKAALKNKLGIRASDITSLELHQCPVDPANIIRGEGEGLPLVALIYDLLNIYSGAMAIGLAKGCLERAVSYAKSRVQFGHPIGFFQQIQFKIAEMASRLSSASLMISGFCNLLSEVVSNPLQKRGNYAD